MSVSLAYRSLVDDKLDGWKLIELLREKQESPSQLATNWHAEMFDSETFPGNVGCQAYTVKELAEAVREMILDDLDLWPATEEDELGEEEGKP